MPVIGVDPLPPALLLLGVAVRQRGLKPALPEGAHEAEKKGALKPVAG